MVKAVSSVRTHKKYFIDLNTTVRDVVALEPSIEGREDSTNALEILIECFRRLILSLSQGCDDEYRASQVDVKGCGEPFSGDNHLF